uniref:NAD-dependent epimerase/dehydratase domain-containing protein n=1 Tax=Kwoniella pini CBS 10737 TaxID=1296096 RepID=A0A1B9I557_9TREE|nr:uncharacterized protein I206_02704 [Kwoniella pini CBS 10737]OCF50650.1 hypothetical protein I206_02704 [Kwoniella pini CBS 10737]
MSDKLKAPEVLPSVLILGGTTTIARTLAQYLLSPDSPKASFVRLADRFSVNPPTTYLDKSFLSLLNYSSSKLEYKQVNLLNTAKHIELFTPPTEFNGINIRTNGEDVFEGFGIVFDLTGEVSFDKPELLQISNTYQTSLSLATSASKLPSNLKPKSYVRLTFPFYEQKSLPSSSAGHSESAELKPDGVRGRWWNEVLRGIGQLDLNFGVIRCAAWYGPGTYLGEIVPRLVVGHVYQYLQVLIENTCSADLRVNTVHSLDVAQALYLLSLYLLSKPRSEVISESSRSSISETWKTIPTVVPENITVKVPLFNVVDENDSTQGSLAKIVAETWSIKFGFLNSAMASLVQQFAKNDFTEMVEDVNEMHVEAWSKMLASSDPPIESSPITPFLDDHAFRKMSICLDGSKAKRILGFKAIHPKVQVQELREIIKGFQEDRLWPKLS